MTYEFDWSSIPGALPFLWDGMKISLVITAQAVVIGVVWGTLLAMMRLSSIKPLSWFAAGYVNLFRAVPLVMVLLWFFLIVPEFVGQLFNIPKGTDLRLSSAMAAASACWPISLRARSAEVWASTAAFQAASAASCVTPRLCMAVSIRAAQSSYPLVKSKTGESRRLPGKAFAKKYGSAWVIGQRYDSRHWFG